MPSVQTCRMSVAAGDVCVPAEPVGKTRAFLRHFSHEKAQIKLRNQKYAKTQIRPFRIDYKFFP